MLSRVRVTEGKITVQCMKEIQGKSTLVRVRASFELARVRVIGSQLYTVLRTRAGFILMHTTGVEANHVI